MIISITWSMLCVRGLMYVASFNVHNQSVKDVLLFPFLKMGKLRLKEINSHIHTASK